MNSVPSMQDLLSAGVHFGHQVRRAHPRMKPFIYGARDGVHIIDLAKSEEKLKEAVNFAYKLGKEGKVLLIVGTKKQAREIVKTLSDEVDAPYIIDHWVGGLLTNFDEVKRNINKNLKLQEEKETGELSRFTKKEQLLISRKLEKFARVFGGVAKLAKLPDAVFIIDCVADLIAVKEANQSGVLSLGFADTNSNPDLLDFPIPANDDGIKSIRIITETVIKAYGQGKKDGGKEQVVSSVEEVSKEDTKDKKKETKSKKEPKDGKDESSDGKILDGAIQEQAEVLEEEIEKVAVEESERKVE